jgi:endonuclease/exonuclease/phosphatase family metal-dependent hydrolase
MMSLNQFVKQFIQESNASISILFRSAFLLVIAGVFSGCPEPPTTYDVKSAYFQNPYQPITAKSTITCVSYNIQCGFPADKSPWTKEDIGATPEHIKALAAHIRSLNPDIIFLQEVALNRTNTEVKDMLAMLASELKMNYAFGSHGLNDAHGISPVKAQWGNAILTRFRIEQIENTENEKLSEWERRSIISALIDIGGKRIIASSLHHIPTEESDRRAKAYFQESAERFGNLPRIIGGDFNRGGEISEMESLGLTDALLRAEPSVDSIDKLYVSSSKFSVSEAGLGMQFGTPEARLSDHFSVYCKLNIRF